MHLDRNSSDEIILKALKDNGYTLPIAEDDINEFFKIIEQHEFPPLPENLDDPENVLNAEIKRKNITLPTDEKVLKSTTQFSMAARDGKALPQDVLDKLNKDFGKK